MTRVTLIASTRFYEGDAIEAAFDATGKTWMPNVGPSSFRYPADEQHQGALVSEFAGRACYESFDRPNEATAATKDYLAHIIEVQHGSVLEHGTATFYISGASRSFTHELVRHRHLSFSQLSQRYARLDDTSEPVIPPLFQGNKEAEAIIASAWTMLVVTYQELAAIGESIARDMGQTGTARRKTAREAARCVLPNMTPTGIVVTGNHRAWREFLAKRATVHADREMSEIAVKLYDFLQLIEPHVYQDFVIDTPETGRVVLRQKESA